MLSGCGVVSCDGRASRDPGIEEATVSARRRKESRMNEHDCTAGIHERTLSHGGVRRTYLVHIPSSFTPHAPCPLVLAFHGGEGTAEGFVRFTGFDTLSEAHGFIAVFPRGVDNHWNDGRNSELFREHEERTDDVGFIAAVVDALRGEFGLDPARVFAFGMSNGGMFAHRLAIDRAPLFRAVACVAAPLPSALAETRPPGPVSVLVMNGTADPMVPYGGGELRATLFPRLSGKPQRKSRGTVLSTDDTVRFWLRHNRIASKGVTERLPGRDEHDGVSVERTTWADTGRDISVVRYRIEGGGHTWPGGVQYLPERVIGTTSRGIDASEVIWKFFAAQG